MTRSIIHAPHASSRPAARPVARRGARQRRSTLQHPTLQHPTLQQPALQQPALQHPGSWPPALRPETLAPLTLTPERLADIKQRLESQREFRIEQLTALKNPDPSSPFSSTDREVLASLFTGAKTALHEVQSALWRLEEGRYGLCTGCGAPLAVESLEVVPQTAKCWSCLGGAALAG